MKSIRCWYTQTSVP